MWPELSVAWTSRFFLWLYSRHNMGILSKRAWRFRFGGSTNPGIVFLMKWAWILATSEMIMSILDRTYWSILDRLSSMPLGAIFSFELFGVGLVVWQNYWVLGQWTTPWRTGNHELRLLTFGDLFGLSLYFARSHFFTDEMKKTKLQYQTHK